MKKKIKDLTPEERRNNFCNKYDECEFCPLCIGANEDNVFICVEQIMDKEVEVDE